MFWGQSSGDSCYGKAVNTCPFYLKVFLCLVVFYYLSTTQNDPQKNPRSKHRKARYRDSLKDIVRGKRHRRHNSHLTSFSIMETVVYSGSRAFFRIFLVNVIKALTPSCLVPTFSPLSTAEPWLLLSSSVSKLNNHEEKNITCGKFTPFFVASYYPNSSLILYHHYPPTNDRVEATVSQHFSAKKENKTKHGTLTPSLWAVEAAVWHAPFPSRGEPSRGMC